MGHWLWRLIDVEGLVMVDSSFAISVSYYDDIRHYNFNASASIVIDVQIYRMLGSNTLTGKKIITLDWHQCSNL